jgi:hypothetical protein
MLWWPPHLSGEVTVTRQFGYVQRVAIGPAIARNAF